MDMTLSEPLLMENEQDFIRVRDHFAEFSKYHDLNNIAPYILYMFFKIHQIPFHRGHYLNLMQLSNKDLIRGLKELYDAYPEYGKRNREEYVKCQVEFAGKYLELGSGFTKCARSIFEKLRPLLKHTSEEVKIGTCTTLASIALGLDVRIKLLCNLQGIPSSTIFSFFKKKLASAFGILNFKGFTIHSKQIKNVLIPHLLPESDRLLIKKMELKQFSPQKMAKRLDVSKEVIEAYLSVIDSELSQFEKNLEKKTRRSERPASTLSQFSHLGKLIEEIRTDAKCAECDSPIYKLEFQKKTLFLCKKCHLT